MEKTDNERFEKRLRELLHDRYMQEKFNVHANYHKVIMVLAQGGDPVNLLDQLLKIIDDQQEEISKLLLMQPPPSIIIHNSQTSN